MALLKLGDGGPEVRKLQLLLNDALMPSPRLHTDGDFGPRTREAVLRFQKGVGLKPDGIVGVHTWTMLGQKTSVAPGPKDPVVTTDWMAIARAELGVHEDALPGHHTARIVEYHQTTTLKATTDETPWCSAFVNWVMRKAGHKGTNNALAMSWLKWGRALDTPREGAITVIKKKGATGDAATGSSTGYHVAFCVSVTPTHIRLLGGNQSDQVKYSNFNLAAYDVKGYRWP